MIGRFFTLFNRLGITGTGTPARWMAVDTSGAIRDLLRSQAGAAGQVFVDPIALLCEDSRCPLADEVDFMAFDSGHMGRRGASVALTAYLDAVLQEGQTLQAWGAQR